MRTHQTECATAAGVVPGFVDVTDQVEKALIESGITFGQLTVFCPESECALLVNEHESGLLEDIKRTIDRLSRNGSRPRAGMLGASSVVLPVVDGRLRLGTWQRVLLCVLEGAGDRSLVVQIVGE